MRTSGLRVDWRRLGTEIRTGWQAGAGGDCDENLTISSGTLLLHGFFDVVDRRIEWR